MPEYQAFALRVQGALAIAVEQDPHTIAIQKAIPAVSDRLRTMIGIIQTRQATYAKALYSLEAQLEVLPTIRLTTRLEQYIEGIASALSKLLGGGFHFVPRSQLAPALPAAPV